MNFYNNVGGSSFDPFDDPRGFRCEARDESWSGIAGPRRGPWQAPAQDRAPAPSPLPPPPGTAPLGLSRLTGRAPTPRAIASRHVCCRKKRKSIFARHSGKFSLLAIVLLTSTVIYLHNHRKDLHTRIKAKDHALNLAAEEKNVLTRTLLDRDNKVTQKSGESEHLRRTVERLQQEVATQAQRCGGTPGGRRGCRGQGVPCRWDGSLRPPPPPGAPGPKHDTGGPTCPRTGPTPHRPVRPSETPRPGGLV